MAFFIVNKKRLQMLLLQQGSRIYFCDLILKLERTSKDHYLKVGVQISNLSNNLKIYRILAYFLQLLGRKVFGKFVGYLKFQYEPVMEL